LIVFFGARWHLSGWQLLLPIACAFVLATISYFTVEAWARRLKDWFKTAAIPRGAPVLTVAGT
jgi:peptidoglycan/LPS O-acetylase OafA/YrhL